MAEKAKPAEPNESPALANDQTVASVIAEFSQVFAFARTRWARYAEEVDPGLRGVGMMVLQTILRRGPVTATELSQLLDMDKSVVSRQVATLRGLDLVEAEAAAEDRRVILLTATPDAETTVDRLLAQTSRDYQARFVDWSDADLQTLNELLQRFNRSSGAVVDSPAHRCHRDGR